MLILPIAILDKFRIAVISMSAETILHCKKHQIKTQNLNILLKTKSKSLQQSFFYSKIIFCTQHLGCQKGRNLD